VDYREVTVPLGGLAAMIQRDRHHPGQAMQSALLLGHPNHDNRQVSAALTARDINMLRAEPSSVVVTTSIDIRQPAYDHYVRSLPAFMVATHKQESQTLRASFYPVPSLSQEQLLPIPAPPIAVTFQKTPPQSLTEMLSETGYDRQEIRGKQTYIFHQYTTELVQFLIKNGAVQTAFSPIDTTNIGALREYLLIVRIFSSFLRTHTYPAFNDPQHLIEVLESEKNQMDIDAGPLQTERLDSGKRVIKESGPSQQKKRRLDGNV